MKGKLSLIGLFGCCIFSGCSGGSQVQNVYNNSTLEEYIALNDTCKLIDNYLISLAKDRTFSGGLLIIKNGQKLFSKGYGFADKEKKISFTPSTLASMGSITKAFTAAAIMKLYEEGKLSLTDNLKKYFPLVPEDKQNITLHQLLTHSSGFVEFLKNDGGDYRKIETDEYLATAFAEPLSFEPGTKSIYTNVGMSILAIIIERVSGLDYEQFLKKELFEPVGIKDIGYQYPVGKGVSIAQGYENGKDWGTHQSHFEKAGGGPYWNLKGNGGLEASLNEMYLWANAFTNKTILKDSTIQKMFTPHIMEENTGGHYYFGYGCNISKTRRNTKMIDNGGSNGIYFARLLRLPEEGLVFYMVTNEKTSPTEKILPNITQLYFYGRIMKDAFDRKVGFEFPKAGLVYDLLVTKGPGDFEKNLKSAGIEIQDDMILLEAGQKLTENNKPDEAIALYEYYVIKFPEIVVAQNDLGDLYLKKGEKEKAKNCYRRALKIRPENPRAKEALKNLE
ncbi:MAG: serine hydrolase [Ferruginibacter sp.]